MMPSPERGRIPMDTTVTERNEMKREEDREERRDIIEVISDTAESETEKELGTKVL